MLKHYKPTKFTNIDRDSENVTQNFICFGIGIFLSLHVLISFYMLYQSVFYDHGSFSSSITPLIQLNVELLLLSSVGLFKIIFDICKAKECTVWGRDSIGKNFQHIILFTLCLIFLCLLQEKLNKYESNLTTLEKPSLPLSFNDTLYQETLNISNTNSVANSFETFKNEIQKQKEHNLFYEGMPRPNTKKIFNLFHSFKASDIKICMPIIIITILGLLKLCIFYVENSFSWLLNMLGLLGCVVIFSWESPSEGINTKLLVFPLSLILVTNFSFHFTSLLQCKTSDIDFIRDVEYKLSFTEIFLKMVALTAYIVLIISQVFMYTSLEILKGDSPKYRKAHLNEALYQFFTFVAMGIILLAIGISMDIGYYVWGLIFPDSSFRAGLKGLPIVYVPNSASVNTSYLTDSSNDHIEKFEGQFNDLNSNSLKYLKN